MTYSVGGSKSGKGKSASGSVDEGISSSKSGKGKSGHFKGISSNGYKDTGYGHFSSKTPFVPENANATSIKIQAPLGICPSVELCGCVCLYEPQIGNDCLTTEQANMLIATADASFVCSSDGISSQDACDTLAEQHVPGFLSENGLGSPQGYTCIRAWDSSITETSGPIQIFSPTGVPEV
ncbi:hypothetical protein TL16_g11447 [Triparma laevis f. inornata]|uniref:Uncharacterized protein n=1 Tax=Triparma laevis f. inornata TaxID=1714386 RepID=A0A9W7ERY4_9STRA|nr:hypothetical protein TL16_g11447 [Triparma laevis f. inornata]